ncbi:MAG: inositol-3-phosphate synthase [Dehalococcoidia bacterium]|nr:inositol-3-phosphate synthase [Dehalococcoidia bacterium]
MSNENTIEEANGKLGILTPGMGAVATTTYAGIISIKKGISPPIGSLTQMGHIRIGDRSEDRQPLIKDFVPLANLDDIVFGGWDPIDDNAYEAAMRAGVLEPHHLQPIREEMEAIKPMSAVFDQRWVKNLDGPNVKKGVNKLDLAEQIMHDIEQFKTENNCSRLVIVWCGSTEAHQEIQEVHQSIETFEAGLKNDDPAISPSQIYAYAAITKGIPFANGAPNLSVDIPAIIQLAEKNNVPIAGKDFKTGQTLLKTILAPGFKSRLLGLNGWFSTNILGNRDGEVLDDPDSFKSKEVSKLGVLETILQPDKYPDLYKDLYHKVRINYYPPRRDNKEGWDNIDIFGWMQYPMQIKIDFLCRDSILAAPIVLDLALFMDLANRNGQKGVQEWLSFYFKSPQTIDNLTPENDLFIQQTKLKNTLRLWMNEKPVTHIDNN